MNKKILIGSILAVLMLIAISFATTVSSNTASNERKESPLFRIRTRLAIGERLKDLSTRFLRQRVFFLPIRWLSNGEDFSVRQNFEDKGTRTIDWGFVTCAYNHCYTWCCTALCGGCDTIN